MPDAFQSFVGALGAFLWGVIKRFYFWLLAFVLDPFDIWNKFLRPIWFGEGELEWNVPIDWFPYVLGGLVLWTAFLTYHELYVASNTRKRSGVNPPIVVRDNETTDDPRVTALPLLDEGKDLRKRCEGGDRPPIEAIERWRERVIGWLQDNGFKMFKGDWDVYPGKSSLDPPVIPQFTGMMMSGNLPLWQGVNIRVLRLEELIRRL